MLNSYNNSSGCVVRTLPHYDDLLSLHQALPERYPYLLESTAQADINSRYDILFAFPQHCLTLNSHGLHFDSVLQPDTSSFLDDFDEWYQQVRCAESGSDLPFTGGWFIYLGYELVSEIEPRLPFSHRNIKHLPTAFATRITSAVIRDHKKQCTYLVSEAGDEQQNQILLEDYQNYAVINDDVRSDFALELTEETSVQFTQGVETIKEYIRAGDVFQVNLSRSWKGKLAHSAQVSHYYKKLRETNPAPFAGLIKHNNAYIMSSSPERLVKVKNGIVEVRPIAGTRPRNEDVNVDKNLSEALLAHPKERAEHVMLIDLERNDLGRICHPGSIEVNELMVLESYQHVHHIVSNIKGHIKASVSPSDVIRAVFPGGTITGCPKVRCMEIINELEHAERGPYTGSLGYINRDGSMDLNILIRTILADGDDISFRTGAGIVMDSDAEMELQETQAKAKGLLLALGLRAE